MRTNADIKQYLYIKFLIHNVINKEFYSFLKTTVATDIIVIEVKLYIENYDY